MSYKFEAKYDQLKSNDPTEKEAEDITEKYSSPGNVRNVCFVQIDGNRTFLNYSYLVSGNFIPEDNSIYLTFTTHEVSLKGSNLSALFDDLMSQITRNVICEDSRYNAAHSSSDTIINQIVIVKN